MTQRTTSLSKICFILTLLAISFHAIFMFGGRIGSTYSYLSDGGKTMGVVMVEGVDYQVLQDIDLSNGLNNYVNVEDSNTGYGGIVMGTNNLATDKKYNYSVKLKNPEAVAITAPGFYLRWKFTASVDGIETNISSFCAVDNSRNTSGYTASLQDGYFYLLNSSEESSYLPSQQQIEILSSICVKGDYSSSAHRISSSIFDIPTFSGRDITFKFVLEGQADAYILPGKRAGVVYAQNGKTSPAGNVYYGAYPQSYVGDSLNETLRQQLNAGTLESSGHSYLAYPLDMLYFGGVTSTPESYYWQEYCYNDNYYVYANPFAPLSNDTVRQMAMGNMYDTLMAYTIDDWIAMCLSEGIPLEAAAQICRKPSEDLTLEDCRNFYVYYYMYQTMGWAPAMAGFYKVEPIEWKYVESTGNYVALNYLVCYSILGSDSASLMQALNNLNNTFYLEAGLDRLNLQYPHEDEGLVAKVLPVVHIDDAIELLKAGEEALIASSNYVSDANIYLDFFFNSEIINRLDTSSIIDIAEHRGSVGVRPIIKLAE